jgi:hypothetical protein
LKQVSEEGRESSVRGVGVPERARPLRRRTASRSETRYQRM